MIFLQKNNIITYLLDCQMVNFSLLKLEERVCELDQWLYKKPSPEKNIDFTRFIQEKNQYFVQYELILNFSGTLLTQLLASPSSSVANNTESPSRTVLKKNLPPSKSKHKLRLWNFFNNFNFTAEMKLKIYLKSIVIYATIVI